MSQSLNNENFRQCSNLRYTNLKRLFGLERGCNVRWVTLGILSESPYSHPHAHGFHIYFPSDFRLHFLPRTIIVLLRIGSRDD